MELREGMGKGIGVELGGVRDRGGVRGRGRVRVGLGLGVE